MALTLDISDDYLIFDNLIKGVYTALNGIEYRFLCAKVYPKIDETKEVEDIGLQTGITYFCLWNAEINFSPENNAQFETSENSFRVIGYNKRSWDTRYVLTCVLDAGEHIG
jgi:hypothetical protein